MFNFIVLGLVPGTHIQITFLPWMLMVFSISGFMAARRGYRSRWVRVWLISLMMLRAVRRAPAQV